MATHTNPLARDFVDPQDINLVEHWVKKDRTRWMAGAMAGVFASLVALAFAGILAVIGGYEFLFPAKYIGQILVGSHSTELGFNVGHVLAGVILFAAWSALMGWAYGHFVFTNALPGLLGMGVTWGVFGWIFVWNLYLPSFSVISAAKMGSGPVFLIMIVWGLALTSVAAFDRAIRK